MTGTITPRQLRQLGARELEVLHAPADATNGARLGHRVSASPLVMLVWISIRVCRGHA